MAVKPDTLLNVGSLLRADVLILLTSDCSLLPLKETIVGLHIIHIMFIKKIPAKS